MMGGKIRFSKNIIEKQLKSNEVKMFLVVSQFNFKQLHYVKLYENEITKHYPHNQT